MHANRPSAHPLLTPGTFFYGTVVNDHSSIMFAGDNVIGLMLNNSSNENHQYITIQSIYAQCLFNQSILHSDEDDDYYQTLGVFSKRFQDLIQKYLREPTDEVVDEIKRTFPHQVYSFNPVRSFDLIDAYEIFEPTASGFAEAMEKQREIIAENFYNVSRYMNEFLRDENEFIVNDAMTITYTPERFEQLFNRKKGIRMIPSNTPSF